MRVAFDGGILAAGPPTGVGRALLTSIQAYAEHAPDDIHMALIAPAGSEAALPERVQVLRTPATRGARRAATLAHLSTWKADVLHAPVAAVPRRAPCPTIATIHDLPWRHAATRRERGTRWRHRWAALAALRRAAAVVVPSEATAADLRAWRPASTNHVRVIPHCGPRGVPQADAPPAGRQGSFLVLGDDRPRKNRTAVSQAHRRAKAADPGLPDLRFVGPPTDYVTEEAKSALLSHCRGVLHFSHLEGFGLPVLEALAHGAPVACSPLPALQEIAGAAALYADPCDLGAMADAMVRLHRDSGLRRELAQLGLLRAQRFSTQANGRAHVQLHRDVVALGPGPSP